MENYIRGSGSSMQYFIPPEIVIQNVYGKYYSVEVGKGGWVPSNKFGFYLNPQGWTEQEYYNVYILKIGRYDTPKCKCGNPLKWQGKISWGYYQYCSLKCSQAALGESETFRTSRSNYMKDLWKDPEYVKSRTDKHSVALIYAAWSKGALYKQIGNKTIGWFYVSIGTDRVKIGASLNDYNNRLCYSINRVFSGTPEEVIECEYLIKIENVELLDEICEKGHSGWTETFSKDILTRLDYYISKFNLKELSI